MSAAPAPKYVDAAALEVRFSCDRSAFPRWQKSRGFPAPRYLGHRRLWLLSEIEAWEAQALSAEPSPQANNLTPMGGTK